MLTIGSSVGQSGFPGLYYCTVENARGRSSRMAVVGKLTLYTHCCYLHYIDKESHPTPFLHEIAFPVKLIRPGIGRNTFYILMSDFCITSKAY